MRRTFSLVGGFLTVFLLVGCGGGGGSSESPYTGVTSQAELTQDNVVDVTTEAYQAGDLAASAVIPLDRSEPARYEAGSPRAIALVRLLQGVAERARIPVSSPSYSLSENAASPMDVVTVSDTITDGFGGTAIFSLTLDTVTGDFTGTFTFTGWHGEGGALISGTTSVTGHFDESADEFTEIRFTFHAVTMVDGLASVTLTGTVELSISVLSSSATVELYLQESGIGKTVWIHGYTVTMTEGPDVNPVDGIPDYTDVDVSGRIYLHDYGYVDVSTPTPFRFNSGSTYPDSGVLQVDGSLGRSAQLVVISEVAGYFVQADLDGDPGGIYEWTSIDYPWV
ncbi:MAG: hypothetical protein HKM86_02430 [Deltaproteobacteria bacterium]|nr:hypothetical protein [Deltaproteobacteria bacterium]